MQEFFQTQKSIDIVRFIDSVQRNSIAMNFFKSEYYDL